MTQSGTISSTPVTKAAARQPASRTKLLLEGPILPTLLRLSAPNILNLLAFVGVIVFDGFFLGRIGTDALAGASLAFPFVMLVLQTTNSGMGAGVSSAVARALGACKRGRADEIVFHAFLLALALGAIFSIVMLLAAVVKIWQGIGAHLFSSPSTSMCASERELAVCGGMGCPGSTALRTRKARCHRIRTAPRR